MKTPRILFTIIALFAYANSLTAQVGIGTTNPQATLHVKGDLKIEPTVAAGNAVNLSGLDTNGLLTDVTLGANLTLSAGTLSATGGGGDHTKEKIVLTDESFAIKNNWNLGLTGANSDVTVFIIRKQGGGNTLTINGIADGTDGRRIRIINDSNKDIVFNEDTGGNAGNKIYIYTTNTTLNNYGSCELIYSTAISTDGHWNIVQLDPYN